RLAASQALDEDKALVGDVHRAKGGVVALGAVEGDDDVLERGADARLPEERAAVRGGAEDDVAVADVDDAVAGEEALAGVEDEPLAVEDEEVRAAGAGGAPDGGVVVDAAGLEVRGGRAGED